MINGKLKGVNMMSFIIFSMISIRLVILPGDIIKYAKNDAWISVLVASAVAYISAFIAYYITSRNPGYNFAQLHTKLLGQFLGKFIMLAMTVYIITVAGMSLRLFSDSMKMFLLDRTPSIVIVGIMLFTCFYCLVKGIKTISIVYDIIFPVVIIIIIIPLMTYKSAELKNLLPIIHNGISPIMKGSLYIIDSSIGCGIISYIMPYFEDSKQTKKWIIIGVTISVITYAVLVTICILVFGAMEVQYLSFPSILLAKTVEFRAEIFERVESFFMASWIPCVFANIISLCIIAILNLKEILSSKKINRIIILVVLSIMMVTFMPKDFVDVYENLLLNSRIAAYINLIYIPIFFIIVVLKERGRKKYEK